MPIQVLKLNWNLEIGTGTGEFEENVGGKPQEMLDIKFVINCKLGVDK